MTKIGLIREGKVPIDRRVPVTPLQAKAIQSEFHDVKVVAQSSTVRCFDDQDYRNEGIEVVEEVDDCDILLGVKEVPIENLIPDKTYFFFSHTIKQQAYNRDLLRAVLKKNIRLVDYETLTDVNGKRIIAFGRWAGIVGAYNALWTFGQRYNLYDIRRAYQCLDLEDMKREFSKIELPPIKIAVTGGGRVAKGAMEVLHKLEVHKVTPQSFTEDEFPIPVFSQLNTRDYNVRQDGGEFNRSEFYSHPDLYHSDFLKFAHVADVLIACAFWEPRAPVLFHREDVMHGGFQTTVIADVTCDIEGSIPSTKKASTIEDPIYDYNPSEDKMEPPLTDEANITVMAVDNLPCELPRDASESFGDELIAAVLPHLLNGDEEGVIARATIARDGKLTEEYSYLRDYVEGKSSASSSD